ncbi:MAG: four helix bundle protein [Lentimicrobiaceae bacterium]|nr:four helix bundle protein [Lentimicrobiaceae bacterium]
MNVNDLSFDFAKRIVNLHYSLNNSHKEYIISKQILRSGTSIGANISESKYPQSDADYVHKISIALKEASETEFWLKLLKDCKFITDNNANSLLHDCSRIIIILISIIKKVKKRINTN